MASSQVARKYDFVAKVAGGCSSYDVIALWPDLTRSILLPKVTQGLPHKVAEIPAAPRKTSGGGVHHHHPVRARVNCDFLYTGIFVQSKFPYNRSWLKRSWLSLSEITGSRRHWYTNVERVNISGSRGARSLTSFGPYCGHCHRPRASVRSK